MKPYQNVFESEKIIEDARIFERTSLPLYNLMIENTNNEKIKSDSPVIKLDRYDKGALQVLGGFNKADMERIEGAKIASLSDANVAVIHCKDNSCIELTDAETVNHLFPNYTEGYLYPSVPEYSLIEKNKGMSPSMKLALGASIVLGAAALVAGCVAVHEGTFKTNDYIVNYKLEGNADKGEVALMCNNPDSFKCDKIFRDEFVKGFTGAYAQYDKTGAYKVSTYDGFCIIPPSGALLCEHNIGSSGISILGGLRDLDTFSSFEDGCFAGREASVNDMGIK